MPLPNAYQNTALIEFANPQQVSQKSVLIKLEELEMIDEKDIVRLSQCADDVCMKQLRNILRFIAPTGTVFEKRETSDGRIAFGFFKKK